MKGRNYRSSRGQAYTRGKYIHGSPASKISKYVMGGQGDYKYKVTLISQGRLQIRHNAIEAARISANKMLTDKLGETGYLLHLRIYPHVVLRENKMIATAGADRLQEGMRKSFGKPTSRAARVTQNQELIDIYVNENTLKLAQEALFECSKKLPMPCRIAVEKLAESPQKIEA